MGEIAVWEVGSREQLVLRNFKVWDLSARSTHLKVCSLVLTLTELVLNSFLLIHF